MLVFKVVIIKRKLNFSKGSIEFQLFKWPVSSVGRASD